MAVIFFCVFYSSFLWAPLSKQWRFLPFLQNPTLTSTGGLHNSFSSATSGFLKTENHFPDAFTHPKMVKALFPAGGGRGLRLTPPPAWGIRIRIFPFPQTCRGVPTFFSPPSRNLCWNIFITVWGSPYSWYSVWPAVCFLNFDNIFRRESRS